MAKLIEIAELNPGLDESLESNARVSFLPMSAVTAETASTTSGEERHYSEVSKGYTPFLKGDVLVAKITPCFENGKIAQAMVSHRVGFGSTEFHVVRPRPGMADARYILHFLRQEHIRRDGERRMTGSAGQRRVPEHFLAGLQVPTPALAEQRRIALILDQAEQLRSKRRGILAQLDVLARAIFLDLFGDPAINPKGWPLKSIGQLALRFSDGPFGSNLKTEHYTESGVRVVRLQNIGIDEFLDEDKAYVSERHFGKLRKHECRPGDVLIGTLGEPNLRACVQPDWLKLALNKADCVQFRPDERIANSAYVCALLNQPSAEHMAQELMHGQTRVRISMGRLRDLQVPVPPVEVQGKFARQIAGLQKIKKMNLTWLRETDALFTVLQNRAFRGEL
jgi:type I restriction enzyme, S subunit